jgi:hypothetical protein
VIVALLAIVFETDVLPDEQARRLVIELLVDFLAELLTEFATVGAPPQRFGEWVLLAVPRQVLGQRLAAMSLAFGFRRFLGRFGAVSRFGGGGIGTRGHLGNELRLLGIEPFGLGSIKPAQEQIEAIP